MFHQIEKEWRVLLENQGNKEYFVNLMKFLEEEYQQHTIFPRQEDIFRALNMTSYHSTKAVILGQDPYHGEGQAQGLSFSVSPSVKVPPSLRNIFIELKDDLGCSTPHSGSLKKWSEEGVLLLNTVLTVRKGEPNSHKGKGWEQFSDEVIRLLNERVEPLVFILWGKHAQQKKHLITSPQHLIIESPHPSPFAARKGFFGSKPFSKTNDFLRENHTGEIDWCLMDV
ncbi:uracil-DNA glycosylase [Metabacillus litoralis]|uniref:uracil-DNA glycosylase n=1 Tax=Metabacillus litoralis TaxID=152268 RepID=UPI001CFDAC2C|nr:uracil-DNA glycosylase [Metabacillus litoralis]